MGGWTWQQFKAQPPSFLEAITTLMAEEAKRNAPDEEE